MSFKEGRPQQGADLLKQAVYLSSLQQLGHPVQRHILMPEGQNVRAVARVHPRWARLAGLIITDLHVLHRQAGKVVSSHKSSSINFVVEMYVQNSLVVCTLS